MHILDHVCGKNVVDTRVKCFGQVLPTYGSQRQQARIQKIQCHALNANTVDLLFCIQYGRLPHGLRYLDIDWTKECSYTLSHQTGLYAV